jgi:hypothetical protein
VSRAHEQAARHDARRGESSGVARRDGPGRPPFDRRSLAVVIVGLVGLCGLLWRLRAEVDPDPPAAPARAGNPDEAVAPGAAAAHAAAVPSPAPPTPELPRPPEVPELRGHDTVDPCTALFEPAIPAGYETVAADGVTVAWRPASLVVQGPYDVEVAPTAIAYLVHGLLAEAAALTATPRRERITVVVYARDVFHAETGAPRWSDGVYDGGAVRIAARPSADLGVEIASLRHEVMHAQLHPVGCMPAWLDEGIAMYFAGTPAVRTWIRMLRNPDSVPLRELAMPSFDLLPVELAQRAYAESLAMIVYIVDRDGEAGLRAAVQALRVAGTGSPRAGQLLWDRLYPGIGHRELVDVLAHRVFGVAPGSELDAILRGAICCHGLHSAGGLRCRGVAPRADRTRWMDFSAAPAAVCDATW